MSKFESERVRYLERDVGALGLRLAGLVGFGDGQHAASQHLHNQLLDRRVHVSPK